MGATVNFILMALAANLVSGQMGPRNGIYRYDPNGGLRFGDVSTEVKSV